ncbi:DUF222 domain-containing protein [Mycobacterium sp. EPa45]|uniref:DUF222 domain-containing protein n=1 Tax=Mycobacterium sp. EPa45 TaxID=1545728 RepID=UPI00350F7966
MNFPLLIVLRLEEWETLRRQQVAVSHALISRLEQVEGCPPVPITLADVLRISPREAKRRIRDAEQVAPRRALTGEPLPPLLPDTSKAWHAGKLDGEHLRVIQKFFRDLPDHVPAVEMEKAERTLAEHAVNLRPDQVEKIAQRLALHLNPDGTFFLGRPRPQAWVRLVRRPTGRRHERGQADRRPAAAVHARCLVHEIRRTRGVQPGRPNAHPHPVRGGHRARRAQPRPTSTRCADGIGARPAR